MIEIWWHEGKWWVVQNGTPRYSCASAAGALSWVHGYTGVRPSEEIVRNAAPYE